MIKLRSNVHRRARIEIIPMIDVIFFLLIFFMMSSTFSQHQRAISISLPKTSQNTDAIRQDFILSIAKDGSLAINHQPARLETLQEQLVYVMKNQTQGILIVQADRLAPYERIIQAMDRARLAGIRKFALATDFQKQ